MWRGHRKTRKRVYTPAHGLTTGGCHWLANIHIYNEYKFVFRYALAHSAITSFSSSIEFLTGTKDQVAKAAKAYRVYFSKTEEHDEGEDYLVDHSIVIYLLAPDGDFLDFFTQRTTVRFERLCYEVACLCYLLSLKAVPSGVATTMATCCNRLLFKVFWGMPQSWLRLCV